MHAFGKNSMTILSMYIPLAQNVLFIRKINIHFLMLRERLSLVPRQLADSTLTNPITDKI